MSDIDFKKEFISAMVYARREERHIDVSDEARDWFNEYHSDKIDEVITKMKKSLTPEEQKILMSIDSCELADWIYS